MNGENLYVPMWHNLQGYIANKGKKNTPEYIGAGQYGRGECTHIFVQKSTNIVHKKLIQMTIYERRQEIG